VPSPFAIHPEEFEDGIDHGVGCGGLQLEVPSGAEENAAPQLRQVPARTSAPFGDTPSFETGLLEAPSSRAPVTPWDFQGQSP
jgi:hypothetical protein